MYLEIERFTWYCLWIECRRDFTKVTDGVSYWDGKRGERRRRRRNDQLQQGHKGRKEWLTVRKETKLTETDD